MTDEIRKYWRNRIEDLRYAREKLRRAILAKNQKEITKYTNMVQILKL